MKFVVAWRAFLLTYVGVEAFAPSPSFLGRRHIGKVVASESLTRRNSFVFGAGEVLDDDDDFLDIGDDDEDEDDYDDEDDEEEDEKEPYQEMAASEFLEDDAEKMDRLALPVGSSSLDWGGEYGKLRERVEDSESGKSQSPSYALFRVMTAETPNRTINNFVRQAKPELVNAMSGAVSALLGGLSNPAMGIESVVKASGDKIANLCFQLQMTGYMFRNAEYVLALKDLMNLQGSASLAEYKEAFQRLDEDGSGYIETSEIESLLSDVYGGDVPQFEIDSFLRFFDSNRDGRISWEEFEQGLGAMTQEQAAKAMAARFMLPQAVVEDEDDVSPEIDTEVTGVIEIEMEDGSIIEVEASEYIDGLKREAEDLRKALRMEAAPMQQSESAMLPGGGGDGGGGPDFEGGIAGFIASRKGDVKTLTEGISPEILDTMRMLVDFVLEGGNKKNKDVPKEQIEMELPGSALQQLALWQLVLGYRLREAEAKGEYRRLLE